MAGYRAAWLEMESDRSATDATDEVEADLEDGIRYGDRSEAETAFAELVDPASANADLDPPCSVSDTEATATASEDCRED